MHKYRVHHNCKIDTVRFEEGKRRSRRSALWLREALLRYLDAPNVKTRDLTRVEAEVLELPTPFDVGIPQALDISAAGEGALRPLP